jgi:hypothetical protein
MGMLGDGLKGHPRCRLQLFGYEVPAGTMGVDAPLCPARLPGKLVPAAAREIRRNSNKMPIARGLFKIAIVPGRRLYINLT